LYKLWHKLGYATTTGNLQGLKANPFVALQMGHSQYMMHVVKHK
jgi:hypothetical protein